MKVISDDIKKGEFKSVYLLYGEEEYLKKQYRDRLKNAIAVSYTHLTLPTILRV